MSDKAITIFCYLFDVSGYVPFGGRGQRGAAQERDRAQRAACRKLLGLPPQEELAKHQGTFFCNTFSAKFLSRSRVRTNSESYKYLSACSRRTGSTMERTVSYKLKPLLRISLLLGYLDRIDGRMLNIQSCKAAVVAR